MSSAASSTVASGAGRTAAPLLAVGLLAWIGIAAVLVVDAATFGVAAAVLLAVTFPRTLPLRRLEPLRGEQREILPDKVGLPRIYVAFRAPRFGERDWYAADLLAGVWAGGKSSQLHHELVYRRELAQEVVSWISPTELAAGLLLVVTARPGIDPDELEAALFEQLARIRSEPVAPERLEAARNRILTEIFQDLQKLDRRADLLSQMTTYFDQPERLFTEAKHYLESTPEDLRSYAERFGVPESRAVVVVVPEEEEAT